jgi:diguanylate cyclase (GGDEF)-like protein
LINENASCLPVIENGRLCGALTTTDLMLTLQCMMQLWMRLAQVLQQDDRWVRDLNKIAAGLDGEMTAAQLAQQIAKAREAIQTEVRGLVNAVDLRTDILTDMSNRVGLEEVLDMLLAVKRRFDQSFSLAIVMIDHFQQIKNSCGDIVTGPLLKAVARCIEVSVRDCDFVARCRNDAFAVVMPQTSLEEAESFCANLQKTACANKDLNIKLRISVSVVSPQSGENAAELLQRAEAAVN